MCLLHCSWLSSLYLYWFSRSEIVQLYSVCKLHSCVHASLLMALASLPYWFSRSEIVQFYFICKPHSYVPVSLLMALASPHPLISETRGRSFPNRVGLLLSLRYSVFLYLVDLRYQDKKRTVPKVCCVKPPQLPAQLQLFPWYLCKAVISGSSQIASILFLSIPHS